MLPMENKTKGVNVDLCLQIKTHRKKVRDENVLCVLEHTCTKYSHTRHIDISDKLTNYNSGRKRYESRPSYFSSWDLLQYISPVECWNNPSNRWQLPNSNPLATQYFIISYNSNIYIRITHSVKTHILNNTRISELIRIFSEQYQNSFTSLQYFNNIKRDTKWHLLRNTNRQLNEAYNFLYWVIYKWLPENNKHVDFKGFLDFFHNATTST
jgi:hypothetical protein